MNTEYIFSLEDNVSAIDSIIDNLMKAVKSEEQEFNAMPKEMDGGLKWERHKEIISDLKDAIYHLTNAGICIGAALE